MLSLNLIFICMAWVICILSGVSSLYFVSKGMFCKTNKAKYMLIAAISVTICKIIEINILK